MKHAVVLILVVLAGAGFLFLAWRQGEARQTYTYVPLDKEIPIPLVVDWMAGTAEPKGENLIRTKMGSVMLPKVSSKPYLRCIGSFHPSDTTYYLLELDGVIYVEKEQFVEPLIFGLYNLHRGSSKKPMPATARDAITLLPDNFELLVELAGKIPKSEAPPRGIIQ